MSKTSKKLTASERLAALFDDGIYYEIDAAVGAGCGAKAAYGSVGGATVFAFCQDADAAGGAVDRAQARKLAKVYDLAAKTGAPVVTVYDSKGVRLEDGFGSLEASSEILGKAAALSGVVPQIAVVAGQCAGFMAMMAAAADLCVMCEDAELYMTPAFLDSDTKEAAGSAEFAKKAGIAAIVCADEAAALAKAAALTRLLPLNNLASLPVFDFDAPAFDLAGGVIPAVADEGSVIELFEGVSCVSAALATVGGVSCGLLALQDEICKCGAAKAARLIQLCDAFNLPIITFVDAQGFKKSAHADRAGAIRTAASLAQLMAEATTVKISVITGSAIGSVYTAFCGKNAGADMSFAWKGAVISPLPPKAAVALLWDERIRKNEDIEPLAQEYAQTAASAEKAAEAGAVDSVIEPAATRDLLISSLDMLASKRVSRLPKKHGNLPL